MDTHPEIHLYFGHGDRVREVERLVAELAPQLGGCRYDCWFRPETRHTFLALAGPCKPLRARLEGLEGWYLQPMQWKRP